MIGKNIKPLHLNVFSEFCNIKNVLFWRHPSNTFKNYVSRKPRKITLSHSLVLPDHEELLNLMENLQLGNVAGEHPECPPPRYCIR